MKQRPMADLAKQLRGVSYKPTDLHDRLDSNSVILLRANNIADGELNFDDVVYVDKSKVSEAQYLQKGDILICASSGSLNLVGKAAQVNVNGEYTFGAFCKVVRPLKISADYLGAFFQSPYYRRAISALAQGVNINNIKNEHIDSLLVCCPDETMQEEVIRVIRKTVAIIRERKQQLAALDMLIRARFVEMFGDPVSNPRGWPKVRLFELAEIKIGPFGSLLHKEDYCVGGHALVNPSHIVEGKIAVDEKLTIDDEKYEALSAYHLVKGDVVMGRRGEMGRCAVVETDGLLCGTGSLLIRSKGEIKADYIQKISLNEKVCGMMGF